MILNHGWKVSLIYTLLSIVVTIHLTKATAPLSVHLVSWLIPSYLLTQTIFLFRVRTRRYKVLIPSEIRK